MSLQEHFTSRIIGKMIIRAKITSLTNLLIATGDDTIFDFELVRDGNGNPFIPGSSFAGMLRDYFFKLADLSGCEKLAEILWGTEMGKTEYSYQSHLVVDDLLSVPGTWTTANRDGVKIEYETSVSENKYNYEFVNPGCVFTMNLEITLREGMDSNKVKRFVKFIVEAGTGRKYYQGAFTTHSFGLLEWTDPEFYFFDFTNLKSNMAEDWFTFLQNDQQQKSGFANLLDPEVLVDLDSIEPLPEKQQKPSLTVSALFRLKNTLLIGGSGYLGRQVDKTYLTNAMGEPVLSAKSVRGAIRHRALRILKTLNPSDDKGRLRSLFGFVDEQTKASAKAKFRSRESVIRNTHLHTQSRISICRLTGKTMPGALLTEEMIQGGNFSLELEIAEYRMEELKLVLLVLKDMIHEDLPIGGNKTIGRGVLIGDSLTVIGSDGNEINWKRGGKVLVSGTTWPLYFSSKK